jgi:lipid II:glycine glycyltransferase (peptidoglycan interpeptide bridge formation enzyme)
VKVCYEYAFDLNKSLDEIWGGFDMNCKKSIKGCKGVPLEIRQVSDADTFYRIMAERLREKGQTFHARTPAYLKEVLEAFPENVKMYFLYSQDQIAGMQTIIEYKGRCVLWLGSANGHFNEYLIWELLKDAKARGIREFEMPGGDTKRLTPFKSKFNPHIELDFNLSRKDLFGTLAEWAFRNVTKGWV